MGPFQKPWLPSHPCPAQSWAPWRIWQALILIKWCSHDLLTFTFNLKDRVSRPGASQWAARWLAIHCLLWKTHIGPQAPLPTLFTLSYICEPHSPPKRNCFWNPRGFKFSHFCIFDLLSWLLSLSTCSTFKATTNATSPTIFPMQVYAILHLIFLLLIYHMFIK